MSVPTDEAGQIDVLTQALAFAMTTGTEQPLVVPMPAIKQWATALYGYGVRHTDDVTAEAIPPLPQWIRHAAAEAAQKDAPALDHPAAGAVPVEGFASVGRAPQRRKRK